MYLPSLYFWLDSNACSCFKIHFWFIISVKKMKIEKENLRISIQEVSYSIHSIYQQQREGQLIAHALLLAHKLR